MSWSDVSDADLVSSLIEGDQLALAELYDRYAGIAYRTAIRMLGDPGAAEDVVQETMLALWDRAELYDSGVASLGAWLATISRNRAIDRLRTRGRRVVALPLSVVSSRDDEDAESWDRILASGTLLAAAQRQQEPSAASEAAWLRDTLARAVSRLPALERQAIELAYSADLTQTEIASRLGWPLGTVKTRTRRALASLQEAMSDMLGPDQSPRLVEGAALVASPASGAGRPMASERERVAPTRACA